MSFSSLPQVQDQIQKFWSPVFQEQLKQDTLLPSLVNKDYESDLKAGQMLKKGDTVRVSQYNRPTATRTTLGVDSDTFNTSLISTQYVDLKLTKRITAAYEFEDIAELMSQVDSNDPKMRQTLFDAVALDLNDYLYEFVAPSASAPDHILSGVTDFNATQLLAVRKLAAQAKWMRDNRWFILADPSYYTDLLNAQTMTSADYVNDAPTVGGQIINRRFGFNVLEDNSRSTDYALAFHPDWLLGVWTEPRFQLSSLHSNKQFGYVLSVDILVGAALGNDGDVKHIKIYNT
jgi:hypothetical protein